MKIFFSASKLAFYEEQDHSVLPKDAIEVSEMERKTALSWEFSGKRIGAGDNGKPKMIDPPPLTKEQVILGKEAMITPRRLREALLTKDGADWLAQIEKEIADIRSQK